MFSKISIGLGMRIYLLIALVAIASSAAYSHEEDELQEHEEQKADIGKQLKSSSTTYITIASIIAVILVLFSIYEKDKSEKMKMFLFLGIAIPIIIATAYSAGSTIYLNLISEAKGPVHWHADYEIWDCGRKIDLIRPEGISNRVGSAVFHEHNDNRIHVEGVVVDKAEVDLHNFFATVGGMLSESTLYLPVDGGFAEMKNGNLCNGKEAMIQVFLYKVKNPEDAKNWVYEQQKLEGFENYVLAPYSNVPPGDCIIIEFDIEKERTEHICETYKSAMLRGELNGG